LGANSARKILKREIIIRKYEIQDISDEVVNVQVTSQLKNLALFNDFVILFKLKNMVVSDFFLRF